MRRRTRATPCDHLHTQTISHWPDNYRFSNDILQHGMGERKDERQYLWLILALVVITLIMFLVHIAPAGCVRISHKRFNHKG